MEFSIKEFTLSFIESVSVEISATADNGKMLFSSYIFAFLTSSVFSAFLVGVDFCVIGFGVSFTTVLSTGRSSFAGRVTALFLSLFDTTEIPHTATTITAATHK